MGNTLLFYIFVAISIILVIGYFLGRRKNKNISYSTIQSLKKLIKPADQIITNIGGVVGYHLEMDFESDRNFNNLEGTITLLPRHSLLYLPVSKLFRKFDRFYVKIDVDKIPVSSEIKFIENNFLNEHRKEVKNNNKFHKEELTIDQKIFCYYYDRDSDLKILKKMIDQIEGIKYIKEISINSNGEIALLFVPGEKRNKKILEPIINWLQ
ncbi:MAG: hypothetical protein K9M80_02195 [Candidatus Marinimicrobia bacterium]|nr:hypothetical protein [Candidatus Neomarinimicrobiota bacterium]